MTLNSSTHTLVTALPGMLASPTRRQNLHSPREGNLEQSQRPTKRIVDIAVYKQKLQQNKNSIKIYEQFLNQLLVEQAAELDKINKNMNTFVTHLTPPRNYPNLNLINNYPK